MDASLRQFLVFCELLKLLNAFLSHNDLYFINSLAVMDVSRLKFILVNKFADY